MSLFKKEPEWWKNANGMTVTFEFTSEYCGRPVVMVAEFSIQGQFAVLRRMVEGNGHGWVPHQAKEAEVELIKRLKAIGNVRVDLSPEGSRL